MVEFILTFILFSIFIFICYFATIGCLLDEYSKKYYTLNEISNKYSNIIIIDKKFAVFTYNDSKRPYIKIYKIKRIYSLFTIYKFFEFKFELYESNEKQITLEYLKQFIKNNKIIL